VSKDKLNIQTQIPETGHTHELVKHQLTPANGKFPVPYIEHWVLQLQGVAPDRLNDPERLLSTLIRAVDQMELTRVSDHTHYFGPGVSTVIILAESHLSAHTWPELGYCHIDVVTCVKKLTRQSLETALRDGFRPAHMQLVQLEY
jgi:S-adenosylmethionine decarboxylase proenzyme